MSNICTFPSLTNLHSFLSTNHAKTFLSEFVGKKFELKAKTGEILEYGIITGEAVIKLNENSFLLVLNINTPRHIDSLGFISVDNNEDWRVFRKNYPGGEPEKWIDCFCFDSTTVRWLNGGSEKPITI